MGVAVLAASLGACGLATEKFSDDVRVGEAIHSVRIDSVAGSVTLRSGETTTVRRKVTYADERPGGTHRVEGDVLVIEPCPVRDCWIDYDLVVPAGVSVTGNVRSGSIAMEKVSTVNLDARSGDVTARGVTGAVNLVSSSGSVELVDVKGAVNVDAKSGDVSVRDVAGDATLRVASGNVDVVGIGGRTDVESTSGDVRVRLTKAAGLRASSTSGSVDVTVPRDHYRVNARASGDLRNDIGDDPSSPNQLDVAATSGDVTLKFG
ncbi:DUF4097 family beta strand repeat-containing protein [Actinokineospora enzanensis]|uniref:DUF4097 family beta strand repeat-containing protein n=1 Tax=Actinokineospora enzanensis TaxID=155975 RepID=UPI00036066E7|nr:DUF4097 family beta strand repeat-containing protein [Actinokineospora enzanensis]